MAIKPTTRELNKKIHDVQAQLDQREREMDRLRYEHQSAMSAVNTQLREQRENAAVADATRASLQARVRSLEEIRDMLVGQLQWTREVTIKLLDARVDASKVGRELVDQLTKLNEIAAETSKPE